MQVCGCVGVRESGGVGECYSEWTSGCADAQVCGCVSVRESGCVRGCHGG